MSNKINSSFENPIDKILLRLVDVLNPIFRATGHTPNAITTYSFAFGLLSVFFLYTGRATLFVVFLFLSYLMDCLDGSFARKYNMVTQLGDVYDHVTDFVVMSLFAMLLYHRVSLSVGLLVAGAALLMCCHLGCQQRNCTAGACGDGELLDSFKCLCPDARWIRLTKYFGSGTFFTGLAILGVCHVR